MREFILGILVILLSGSIWADNGQGDYALKFDGVDDYVRIPNTGTGVLGVNSDNESFTIET